jgi:hypothetical protein
MSIVTYDSNDLPKVSAGAWARVDAIRDEDIDFSDIPQQNVSQFVPYTERHPREGVTVRSKRIGD